MSSLKYQLQGLILRNKDGSFASQAERRKTLILVASQLKSGGYRLSSVNSLKPKHVNHLVSR